MNIRAIIDALPWDFNSTMRMELEKLANREPVAWMSVSGDWVTTSKPVMENHASKGTVFVPLYK